jgi:hypothetical protein
VTVASRIPPLTAAEYRRDRGWNTATSWLNTGYDRWLNTAMTRAVE